MIKVSRLEEAFTTVLWTGYFPIAPATVASAVTCVILWFVPAGWFLWSAVLIVPATLIGVWLSDRFIAGFEVDTDHRFKKLRRPNPKKNDPDPVVWDEFVGQWITLLAVPHTVLGFAAAFFVFRVLDILKPLGINSLQKARGGWGVMMDDVLAGVWGAALLVVVGWIFPGVLG